jgi:hypothetical protein
MKVEANRVFAPGELQPAEADTLIQSIEQKLATPKRAAKRS